MLLEERIHPAPPTSTDLTHAPAGRGSSSRRRPENRAGGPPRAHEPEARSGWHKGRNEGKIDPSRGFSSVGGTLVGGRDDRRVHRESVGDGGWLPGAGGDGIFHDIAGCNIAGHDHSEGRGRTPYRREESDTRAGERPWNMQSAPVSRGSTGQPAPVMAG